MQVQSPARHSRLIDPAKKTEREREIHYKLLFGVSAVAQWDWQHLGSTGMQVQSLAQHHGLRIPLLQLQLRWQLQLGSDPWPRNSVCFFGVAEKRKAAFLRCSCKAVSVTKPRVASPKRPEPPCTGPWESWGGNVQCFREDV